MSNNAHDKKVLLVRLFCILFVSALSVAAWIAPAYATIDVTVNCPIAPVNKKYVVFAVADTDTYPPPSTQQFCVLVDQGQTTVSYRELLSAGVVDIGWGVGTLGGATNSTSNVQLQQRHDCNQFYRENGIHWPPTDKDGHAIPNGTGVLGDAAFPYTTVSLMGHIRCPDERVASDIRVLQQEATWRDNRYQLHITSQGAINSQYKYLYPLTQAEPEAQIVVCNTVQSLDGCKLTSNCFWANNACLSKNDRSICGSLQQDFCGPPYGSNVCAWNATTRRCISALEQNLINQHPAGSGIIPACAFEGTCRNVNDLLQVAVNAAKYLFSFVGTIAFVFFVYGGFTIVMSMGSSDKVNKGKEILVAAVIGILISFSAYVAVGFLLDALQVGTDFREIKSTTNGL